MTSPHGRGYSPALLAVHAWQRRGALLAGPLAIAHPGLLAGARRGTAIRVGTGRHPPLGTAGKAVRQQGMGGENDEGTGSRVNAPRTQSPSKVFPDYHKSTCPVSGPARLPTSVFQGSAGKIAGEGNVRRVSCQLDVLQKDPPKVSDLGQWDATISIYCS